MTAKERLRSKIEELSELEAGDVLRLIEIHRQDPVLAAAAAAPADDEPLTDADIDAIDAGWAAHERGESVPLDQIDDEPE